MEVIRGRLDEDLYLRNEHIYLMLTEVYASLSVRSLIFKG